MIVIFQISFLFAQELDLSDFDLEDTGKKEESKDPQIQTTIPEEKKAPVVEQKSLEKTNPKPPLEMPEKESKPDFGNKQVQIKEDRSTRYITLSGTLGFSYNYRDDLFTDASLGTASNGLDEDFFDPRVSLQLEIVLENNIKAFIELKNESRTSQWLHTSSGDLYNSNRAAGNQWQWEFEKAYLQINDFLLQGLTLKGGIIPHKYALRADGQSFFINLGEAESPFSSQSDTNAIGFLATYQPINMLELYVDAFYMATRESSFARQDEIIAGLNIDFYLPKSVQEDGKSATTLGRFFNILFAAIQGDNNTPLWTLGFSFDYFLSSKPSVYLVELYGEALFQFGDYSHNGKPPFSSVKDQEHLAFGGYLGTRFSYEESMYKPFVDLSFWYLSGDDNNPNRKKNNDLVTYEDIDSTLIMEENDYGLDIDSNYWAIKFKTGIHLSPLVKEEMRLEILYAYFRAIDVAPGQSRRMGDEIDVRVIWEYSPDLVFSLSAGVLMNSRYLKNAFDEIGVQGKQNTFIVRFETMLRF